MQTRHVVAAALALVCLLIAGCREYNEPVKPTVDLSLVVAAA
jgi:predicted component of type VI protein secretion system